MDKKISNSFDHLTIEQTERLLDGNVEIKISGKDRNRIKNSVFKKIGSSKKKSIYIPKKLVACAAAFAFIFTSLSIVGLDNVYAAVNKLFTFIPGMSINDKSEATIYTLDPIMGQIKSGDSKAHVLNAIYSEGYLTVSIEVNGLEVHNNYFSFFINQKLTDFRKDSSCVLVVASSSMLHFSIKTDTPTSDDIYEMAISGFPEKLSFKMSPCHDYDDITKIGPTDTKNGISITSVTTREDNQLTVWCYPFKGTNSTKDSIISYGDPANAAFNQEKYIETESGKIHDTRDGIVQSERFIFDMPHNFKTATLHIPYLSMLRNEKNKLSINIPKDYTTIENNTSMKCSLGTIKVTEVTRAPSIYEKGKDTISLKFKFDNNDSNLSLYSFVFDNDSKCMPYVEKFNKENGCLEYLDIDVNNDQTKISLDITNLYYYLFGEYVIPLDIQ